MLFLMEDLKCVVGVTPTTTNGAVTGDYISVKTLKEVWVRFSFTQAVSHQTICSVKEATNVSAGSAAAISTVMPNWYTTDTGTTDALTKGTDAATVTLAAGTTNQVVLIKVDPVILSAGFDCIAGYTTASSQSTNFVDISYFGLTRYPSATPPSVIVD